MNFSTHLRAVLFWIFLFLISAFVVAPHAHAASRYHAHHHHHRHAGRVHIHRRHRIAIDMRSGAIETVQKDPFSAIGALFRPSVAATQNQIERGLEVARAAPGHMAAVAAFIAEQAKVRGMDAAWAVHVAATEGLAHYIGDHGTSFGPFQLHYAGHHCYRNPGLGEKFTAATGLDARDPHTWRAQVIFALDWARVHGWSHDWYGWKYYAAVHHASIWVASWHGHHHHHWRDA
jgi:hypothetical protein